MDKLLRGYASSQSPDSMGQIHVQSTVDASSSVMPCVVNSLYSEPTQHMTSSGDATRCQLCNGRDHLAGDCKRRVACQLCGGRGHSADVCRSYCFNCRAAGHSTRDCQGCQLCGGKGHTAADCRTKSPRPRQHQFPQGKSQRYHPYERRGTNGDGGGDRVCYGCNSKGHLVRDCPDRRAPPASGANATPTGPQQHLGPEARDNRATHAGN